MFKFNIGYFAIAALLFWAEVLIAIYLHDPVIRPFGGDFLVVILLYSFIKSFVNLPVGFTAIITLLIAYLIEISQYFHLIYRLDWENSGIARAILGTNFAWGDMVAYTLGIGLVMVVERRRKRMG